MTGESPTSEFYFSTSRTAILEAMIKLPSARITDIANLAEKEPGTVAKVLGQCLSRGIVQKLEGTELYQLNPKLRKHVEFLCREFRAILSYHSPGNRTHADAPLRNSPIIIPPGPDWREGLRALTKEGRCPKRSRTRATLLVCQEN